MKSYSIQAGLILAFAAGSLLAACGTAGAPSGQGEPTLVPVVPADILIVSEGRLVPRESVDLAFVVGGRVGEVLVEEGDVVQAGEVLARLGDREALESSVAAAELELLAAQQERLSAEQAREALFDNVPEARTQALQAVTDAREALRDAERKVNSLNSPASQTDIDAAGARVVLAGDVLDKAEEAYEPYENKSDENVIRAALLSRLAEARDAYDTAVRLYNNLSGVTGNDFDRGQAQAELDIARARLERAKEDYDELEDGPDPDDLALADSRIDTATGRITAAENGLIAAQAALADLELTATIDGTVVVLDLIVGQQVDPGVLAVRLADFSQWYVETDDLTELEVVDVSVEQQVTISPDALPDVSLNGVVESVADFFEEKRGDITYTARILVNDVDPRLRWGMTVEVTFEE